MEAVEEMRNGKKVKRKNGFQLLDIDNKFNVFEIEATDWEVVDENKNLDSCCDDKDWNLAEQKQNMEVKGDYWHAITNGVTIKDVKKCRDLIFKDLINMGYVNQDELWKDITNVIKQRFGDI